jgi:hypothetical protein
LWRRVEPEARRQAKPALAGLSAREAQEFRSTAELLCRNAEILATVDEHLRHSSQTLDLLETLTSDATIPGLDPGIAPGAGEDATQVPLAATLYEMAWESRQKAEDPQTADLLHRLGWTRREEELFLLTSDTLKDVWTTYRLILDAGRDAEWGESPSPDQIWTALESPRRRFIAALGAFVVALQLITSRLGASGSLGPGPAAGSGT